MIIPRAIQNSLTERLQQGKKIVILYGPRQVGKTTLAQSVIAGWPGKTLQVSADEPRYIDLLSSRDAAKLKSFISGYQLVVIDEAQRIPDIGINLKIIHDQFPEVRLLVTGSSSFELASQISEPLTGRTWTFTLYPIAFQELADIMNPFELDSQLPERLVYGSYPEIFSYPNLADREDYLYEIGHAYLYKDILELASIRNSSRIRDLLRLLAYQTGSLVSLSEIATSLGMGKDTVNSYIDLLEKSFVVFRLPGFSRNLRKEVTRNQKIFFYDLGIRNMVIDNFKPIEDRNDVGQLWENFLVAERMKRNAYSRFRAERYFWRTYTGAELDYIEEGESGLDGYEFKLSARSARPPSSWKDNYPNATWSLINRDNYLEFVL